MAIASYVYYTSYQDKDGIGILLMLPLNEAIAPKPDEGSTKSPSEPQFTLRWKGRAVPQDQFTSFSIAPIAVRAFWYVFFPTEDMTGKYELTMSWKDMKGLQHQETVSFSAGNELNKHTVLVVRPSVPHLRSLLISPLSPVETDRMLKLKTVDGTNQEAPAGTTYPAVSDASAKAEAVVRILQHAHSRLRAGLGELWTAVNVSTMKQGQPICELDPSSLTPEEQQEAWAEAITEHICYSTYNGAGQLGLWGYPTVGGDRIHDADAGFLMSVRRRLGTTTSGETAKKKSYSDGSLDYAPPKNGSLGATNATGELCLPLCFACQQLVTWVLKAGSNSARTYTTMLKPVAGTWVGTGKAEGTAIPPKLSGDDFLNWLGNGQLATPRAATLVELKSADGKTEFGPGSIAVFSNGSPAAHGYVVSTLGPPPRPRTVALIPAEIADTTLTKSGARLTPARPTPI